jgi:Rrf2 family iron-sulfur cluster assembly transcriptional regulator
MAHISTIPQVILVNSSFMTSIRKLTDLNQDIWKNPEIFLCMVFSKSFGYALRGILYVSVSGGQKKKISLDEIAESLDVPRHFLGKVLKKLVKAGILSSTRGPSGGFSLNENTLDTQLSELLLISGDHKKLNACVLSLRVCSSSNPCPMHSQAEILKKEWNTLLADTTIKELLKKPENIISRLPVIEC